MLIVDREQGIRGEILKVDHTQYAEAIKIWNSDIDKKPHTVYRPRDSHDIQTILRWVSEDGGGLSVKSGGHGASGAALIHEGSVIDLSLLKEHKIDTKRRSIHFGSGTLSHEAAAIMAPLNQFVPIGTCPFVGLSGLALGGGIGFLSRKYGLTCDNVNSFSLVTGTGELIKASTEEHPELFRALKGAGHCSFGVVTEIDFKLQDIPETVVGGTIAFDISDAPTVLSHYLEWVINGEDDDEFLYCSINNDINDRLSIQIYGLYLGQHQLGAKLFNDIRKWAKPVYDDVCIQPYSDMQGSYEEHVPEYPNLKWKSGFVNPDFGKDFCEILLEQYLKRPNQHCRCHFDPLGGEVARKPVSSSAFICREAPFLVSILAIWYELTEREACIDWAQQTHTALSNFFMAPGHANYDDDMLIDRAAAYFGELSQHLRSLKKTYDPYNIFKGVING